MKSQDVKDKSRKNLEDEETTLKGRHWVILYIKISGTFFTYIYWKFTETIKNVDPGEYQSKINDEKENQYAVWKDKETL